MADELVVTGTRTGVRLGVRVMPRAPHSRIDGVRDGRLVVRVTAAPVEGAANAAVVRTLAKALGIAPGAIEVTQGATSRSKTVEVSGLTAEAVRARLTGSV